MTGPVTYTTVFDVTAAGYRYWTWIVLGLLFVAIAVGVALHDLRRHPERTRLRRAFVWLLPAFPALWTLAVTAKTYSEHARLSSALERGAVAYVEGTVENFVPMPATGHAMEHFEVAGQSFEYSDFVVTGGFNNTASRGGPIRAGLPVRIGHVDGTIVRLDVARK
jgi:hypothetical protein